MSWVILFFLSTLFVSQIMRTVLRTGDTVIGAWIAISAIAAFWIGVAVIMYQIFIFLVNLIGA